MNTETQHTISYAFPRSANAKKVGRDALGAYCLSHGEAFTGHATLAEALAEAAKLGTQPARWSLDHPLNNRMGHSS